MKHSKMQFIIWAAILVTLKKISIDSWNGSGLFWNLFNFWIYLICAVHFLRKYLKGCRNDSILVQNMATMKHLKMEFIYWVAVFVTIKKVTIDSWNGSGLFLNFVNFWIYLICTVHFLRKYLNIKKKVY